jgi:hypothetical protein
VFFQVWAAACACCTPAVSAAAVARQVARASLLKRFMVCCNYFLGVLRELRGSVTSSGGKGKIILLVFNAAHPWPFYLRVETAAISC